MAANDNNKRLTFSEKTLGTFLEHTLDKYFGKHIHQVSDLYSRIESVIILVNEYTSEHKSVRFWIKLLVAMVGFKVAVFIFHIIFLH